MHKFSNSVGLLGSSRDTALYFGDEELWYELRETMVRQNSSNPHKEIKIARLHQQMCFYIICAFHYWVGLGLDLVLGIFPKRQSINL